MPIAGSGPGHPSGDDCSAARWNNPFALATPSKMCVLAAPADSPNKVTCSGSPPKYRMYLFTHSSAVTMSESP